MDRLHEPHLRGHFQRGLLSFADASWEAPTPEPLNLSGGRRSPSELPCRCAYPCLEKSPFPVVERPLDESPGTLPLGHDRMPDFAMFARISWRNRVRRRGPLEGACDKLARLLPLKIRPNSP